MADTSADFIKSGGVEVATNPQALNFTDGLDATESAGTVEIGIAADGINSSKIADDAISLEHLDAGITPSHIVFAAGEFTTAGGDADETITVSGVLATDLVLVNVHTAGATPRTVVDASASAGQIDVDLSGDPSTDHVLTYVVYRAVA